MTSLQIACFAAAAVIMLLGARAEDKRWLEQGTRKTILLVASETSVIVLLRVANLPKAWFTGHLFAFGLAGILMIAGCLNRNEAEKAFRLPFFGSMGGTLLLVNVIERLL